MDFHGMKRKALQALCKKHNLPANTTNLEMANGLASLLKGNEKTRTTGVSCLKGSGKDSENIKKETKKVTFCFEEEKMTKLVNNQRNKHGEKLGEKRRRSRRASMIRPEAENANLEYKEEGGVDMKEISVRATRSRAGKSLENVVRVLSPIVVEKKKTRKGEKSDAHEESKRKIGEGASKKVSFLENRMPDSRVLRGREVLLTGENPQYEIPQGIDVVGNEMEKSPRKTKRVLGESLKKDDEGGRDIGLSKNLRRTRSQKRGKDDVEGIQPLDEVFGVDCEDITKEIGAKIQEESEESSKKEKATRRSKRHVSKVEVSVLQKGEIIRRNERRKRAGNQAPEEADSIPEIGTGADDMEEKERNFQFEEATRRQSKKNASNCDVSSQLEKGTRRSKRNAPKVEVSVPQTGEIIGRDKPQKIAEKGSDEKIGRKEPRKRTRKQVSEQSASVSESENVTETGPGAHTHDVADLSHGNNGIVGRKPPKQSRHLIRSEKPGDEPGEEVLLKKDNGVNEGLRRSKRSIGESRRREKRRKVANEAVLEEPIPMCEEASKVDTKIALSVDFGTISMVDSNEPSQTTEIQDVDLNAAVATVAEAVRETTGTGSDEQDCEDAGKVVEVKRIVESVPGCNPYMDAEGVALVRDAETIPQLNCNLTPESTESHKVSETAPERIAPQRDDGISPGHGSDDHNFECHTSQQIDSRYDDSAYQEVAEVTSFAQIAPEEVDFDDHEGFHANDLAESVVADGFSLPVSKELLDEDGKDVTEENRIAKSNSEDSNTNGAEENVALSEFCETVSEHKESITSELRLEDSEEISNGNVTSQNIFKGSDDEGVENGDEHETHAAVLEGFKGTAETVPVDMDHNNEGVMEVKDNCGVSNDVRVVVSEEFKEGGDGILEEPEQNHDGGAEVNDNSEEVTTEEDCKECSDENGTSQPFSEERDIDGPNENEDLNEINKVVLDGCKGAMEAVAKDLVEYHEGVKVNNKSQEVAEKKQDAMDEMVGFVCDEKVVDETMTDKNDCKFEKFGADAPLKPEEFSELGVTIERGGEKIAFGIIPLSSIGAAESQGDEEECSCIIRIGYAEEDKKGKEQGEFEDSVIAYRFDESNFVCEHNAKEDVENSISETVIPSKFEEKDESPVNYDETKVCSEKAKEAESANETEPAQEELEAFSDATRTIQALKEEFECEDQREELEADILAQFDQEEIDCKDHDRAAEVKIRDDSAQGEKENTRINFESEECEAGAHMEPTKTLEQENDRTTCHSPIYAQECQGGNQERVTFTIEGIKFSSEEANAIRGQSDSEEGHSSVYATYVASESMGENKCLEDNAGVEISSCNQRSSSEQIISPVKHGERNQGNAQFPELANELTFKESSSPRGTNYDEGREYIVYESFIAAKTMEDDDSLVGNTGTEIFRSEKAWKDTCEDQTQSEEQSDATRASQSIVDELRHEGCIEDLVPKATAQIAEAKETDLEEESETITTSHTYFEESITGVCEENLEIKAMAQVALEEIYSEDHMDFGEANDSAKAISEELDYKDCEVADEKGNTVSAEEKNISNNGEVVAVEKENAKSLQNSDCKDCEGVTDFKVITRSNSQINCEDPTEFTVENSAVASPLKLEMGPDNCALEDVANSIGETAIPSKLEEKDESPVNYDETTVCSDNTQAAERVNETEPAQQELEEVLDATRTIQALKEDLECEDQRENLESERLSQFDQEEIDCKDYNQVAEVKICGDSAQGEKEETYETVIATETMEDNDSLVDNNGTENSSCEKAWKDMCAYQTQIEEQSDGTRASQSIVKELMRDGCREDLVVNTTAQVASVGKEMMGKGECLVSNAGVNVTALEIAEAKETDLEEESETIVASKTLIESSISEVCEENMEIKAMAQVTLEELYFEENIDVGEADNDIAKAISEELDYQDCKVADEKGNAGNAEEYFISKNGEDVAREKENEKSLQNSDSEDCTGVIDFKVITGSNSQREPEDPTEFTVESSAVASPLKIEMGSDNCGLEDCRELSTLRTIARSSAQKGCEDPIEFTEVKFYAEASQSKSEMGSGNVAVEDFAASPLSALAYQASGLKCNEHSLSKHIVSVDKHEEDDLYHPFHSLSNEFCTWNSAHDVEGEVENLVYKNIVVAGLAEVDKSPFKDENAREVAQVIIEDEHKDSENVEVSECFKEAANANSKTDQFLSSADPSEYHKHANLSEVINPRKLETSKRLEPDEIEEARVDKVTSELIGNGNLEDQVEVISSRFNETFISTVKADKKASRVENTPMRPLGSSKHWRTVTKMKENTPILKREQSSNRKVGKSATPMLRRQPLENLQSSRKKEEAKREESSRKRDEASRKREEARVHLFNRWLKD
ncbi:uncharacterized protein LOC143888208 isoform X2 [Tasmannia lanceolata]|uniref:uncharacterized protein LOC143888208 isoform X2 n=1 Tax=Tasmannia lanceolata TaxID=3420 RepID=UPI004063E93F